jgi:hypothetical protein
MFENETEALDRAGLAFEHGLARLVPPLKPMVGQAVVSVRIIVVFVILVDSTAVVDGISGLITGRITLM